ncbi:MAG: hypothetical protein IT378_17350 [Sandaracinaceae bacterium]|nr:hypothetical protein [Sandaracinaceae bacterium]
MIDEAPRVASVLLVAHELREPLLRPWLRVVGEPVGYALEVTRPEDLLPLLRARTGLWDVVLVDGESLCSDDDREELLRALRFSPERVATLLYVCTARPSEAEVHGALAWSDDQIGQGGELGRRLQRRVQCVALAPWRRAMAARARPSTRRLRLVRGIEEGEHGDRGRS